MCPISLPICLPYWLWVALMFLGLTSKTALYAVSGVVLVILAYSVYVFVRRGYKVVDAVRKAVGGVISVVGSVFCSVGCGLKKVGEFVAGKAEPEVK